MEKMINLRNLRIEANKTLEEVASEIHVTAGALSHYEQGEREPNKQILINLAKYYKVSTDYLLDYTFEKEQTLKKQITSLSRTELLELLNKIMDLLLLVERKENK
jgi:transcriptional regulator with XRE-family HTH domain